jgi:hypothetical protein
MVGKKIIIIGTRRRDTDKDYRVVWDVFREIYEDGDIIVSGGCRKGGDRFAEVIAGRMGLSESNGKLIMHRPKKPRQGGKFAYTKANYARNTIVAREADEKSVVIACVADDRKGGTEDTLKKLRNFGKVEVHNYKIVY